MSAGGGGGGRWVVSFFAESDELVAFFFELQPLVSPVTITATKARVKICFFMGSRIKYLFSV